MGAATTHGDGRLLILSPPLPWTAAGLMACGCVAWWRSAFEGRGHETVAVGHVPSAGAAGPRAIVDDAALIAATAQREDVSARFVLVPKFTQLDERVVWLSGARLYEARPRLPLRLLGERGATRTRFPSAALANAAFDVHAFVTQRLGHPQTYAEWTDAFGTTSGTAVSSFLEALGGYEVCRDTGRLPLERSPLSALLRAVRFSPGFDAAIGLWPALVEVLLDSSTQSVRELTEMWNHAAGAVSPERRPPAWARVSTRLRRRS